MAASTIHPKKNAFDPSSKKSAKQFFKSPGTLTLSPVAMTTMPPSPSGTFAPNPLKRSFLQWPTFALSMPIRQTSLKTIPSVKTAKKTSINTSLIVFFAQLIILKGLISDRDGSSYFRDFSESCGPHAGD